MSKTAHFIWVGKLDDPKKSIACLLGPKSLTLHDPSQPIKVWVPETSVEHARAIFREYPGIQICSIDEKLRDLRDLEEFSEIIQSCYLDPRIPDIAKKDFLTPVILHQEGGYFFDTSCIFDANPALPELSTEDYKVEMNREVFAAGTEFTWLSPDCWALASGLGGDLSFPEDGATQFLGGTIDANISIYVAARIHQEHIAGSMFSSSIQQGLFAAISSRGTFAHLEPTAPIPVADMDKLKSHVWFRDDEKGPGGSHRVDELKLNKFNLGLWRVQKATDWYSQKPKAFIYLGLEFPYRAKLLHFCHDLLKTSSGENLHNRAFLENLIGKLSADTEDCSIPITDKVSLAEIIEHIQARVYSLDTSHDEALFGFSLKDELEKICDYFAVSALPVPEETAEASLGAEVPPGV